jgi:uncharacterized protein involved in exopolysaccharide biosynthesis
MQFKIENKISTLEDGISQQTGLIRALRLSRDNAMADNAIAKANAYDVLIAQREQELQNLLNLSAQYQLLEAAVKRAENTYEFLLSKEADARIAENQLSSVNFIQLVEPADPPDNSISTFKNSLFILGVVLSLALGIAVAFVWEYIESGKVQEEETQDDFLSQQQPVNIN